MIMPKIDIFEQDNHHAHFTENEQNKAICSLESGKILYFPQLSFKLQLNEIDLIQDNISHSKAKNISYNPLNREIAGCCAKKDLSVKIKKLMCRFQQTAEKFVHDLLPFYSPQLITGRTSLRTIEAKGRITSKKKDDSRLHVDAFPATPMREKRILRVFVNINPHGIARNWHVGEPFQHVAKRFLPTINPPFIGKHTLLKLLGITKNKRSLYDHYMLKLHDHMKLDDHYQQQVNKTPVDFAAGSTWLVFTDTVSHAALAGQYMLEQTFYLPFLSMKDPKQSPQYQLSEMLGKNVIAMPTMLAVPH